MLWENIILALREIRRNVLRSALTVLGIVIGVAAVITMVTLGQGATAKVTSDISSMGSNLMDIRPGQMRHGPGGASSDASPFKGADVTAIQREISSLSAVAPIASQTSQAIYGSANRSTRILGTTSDYLTVRDWPLAMGRAFTEGEIRAGKAVCILGETVSKELFGGQGPIGTTIRLGKVSCKVIGVLAPKGQNSFGTDQDDLVIIPLRTLQRRLVGNTDVASISVSVKDGISTKKAQAEIERLLRERRRIPPGKDDNFTVRDMQEIVSMLTSTTRVLTALLSAVAAVSLLVGGIGIMNIMLVSVTERTREIGTRLAIGARERDVLMQFLIEAVVLSSFGGVCGILLGLGAAGGGARLLGVPFVFQTTIVMTAFAFSAAVGVIFGYFPARKAARMDPIQALRYE
jgi:putative ABC transport system permease protein